MWEPGHNCDWLFKVLQTGSTAQWLVIMGFNPYSFCGTYIPDCLNIKVFIFLPYSKKLLQTGFCKELNCIVILLSGLLSNSIYHFVIGHWWRQGASPLGIFYKISLHCTLCWLATAVGIQTILTTPLLDSCPLPPSQDYQRWQEKQPTNVEVIIWPDLET